MTEIESDFFKSRVLKEVVGAIQQPGTLDESYRIQAVNRSRLGKIAAWKLGGTTLSTQKLFKTDSVYFGPIFSDDVIFTAERCPVVPIHYSSVRGEAEVAFRLSEQVIRPNNLPLLMKEPERFIDAVYPAIELPWSPFPLPKSGLKVLVADMCGSGHLIVGQPMLYERELASLLQGSVKIVASKKLLANGAINAILGGPLKALQDFIRLAWSYDTPILPGQIVSTGGITPCIELPSAQEITVSFDMLGTFSFKLQQFT